ncbi:hypothetical protein ACFWVP_07170 [Streptomyces sp. NPDC058637]|uniref:hypothetical protein n=1 Tax=Streptomyces sp. NPDC058637 TaxID=3346569 RepID=UPI003656A1BE
MAGPPALACGGGGSLPRTPSRGAAVEVTTALPAGGRTTVPCGWRHGGTTTSLRLPLRRSLHGRWAA